MSFKCQLECGKRWPFSSTSPVTLFVSRVYEVGGGDWNTNIYEILQTPLSSYKCIYAQQSNFKIHRFFIFEKHFKILKCS